jgi:hypothetical protein
MPVGHVMGQRTGPARGHKAAVFLAEVFDEKRHTGERSAQIRVGGLPVGNLVEAADDGVQPWIHRVRSLSRQCEKLGGGHLFALHQLGQPHRIQRHVFVKVHAFLRSGPCARGVGKRPTPSKLTPPHAVDVKPTRALRGGVLVSPDAHGS